MKLLGSFILFLFATSSFASLRGGNSKNRRLIELPKEYEVKHGVCRKHSNGQGGGINGIDYVKHMLKHNPQVSYSWCKDLCDNQSSCTGFEWSELGPDSQCEIWNAEIRGFVKKDNHECYVVKPSVQPHGYMYNYGGCRKYANGQGQGNSGDEYDLYRGMNYHDCRDKCSKDNECVGFEYSYPPNRQCEIWHHEIRSVEPKSGLACYEKYYFRSDGN